MAISSILEESVHVLRILQKKSLNCRGYLWAALCPCMGWVLQRSCNLRSNDVDIMVNYNIALKRYELYMSTFELNTLVGRMLSGVVKRA